MNCRRQALPFCLDPAVAVVIWIFQWIPVWSVRQTEIFANAAVYFWAVQRNFLSRGEPFSQPDLYLIPLAELPVLHAQDHRQAEESRRGFRGYRRAEHRASTSLNDSLAKYMRGTAIIASRFNLYGFAARCVSSAPNLCRLRHFSPYSKFLILGFHDSTPIGRIRQIIENIAS